MAAMPPRRSTSLPKSYGRQADGKTIKSLSLDAELVKWSESQADAIGMSFSSWINAMLQKERDKKSKGAAPKAATKPAAKAAKKKSAKKPAAKSGAKRKG